LPEAIVLALPGHDSLSALSMEVARRTGAPDYRIEAELRQFALLGLLVGTCDGARARLRAARTGGMSGPRVLPGSRFACQHSGACCRGYIFGPISPAEKARIQALNPVAAMPRLADRTLFSPAEDGTYRLGMDGEVCVFYEAGSGCGLHRAFGAEAKPRLCRLFPLGTVATIDGLKIYDRGECATFAISSGEGVGLAEQLPPGGDGGLYHPVVRIHGATRCDYGLVLSLADRLDAEVAGRDPFAALQAIGHVTRAFIVALSGCSLSEGEPEATAATALAITAAAVRPPKAEVRANAAVGRERLAALAQALGERIADGDEHAPAFHAAVDALATACRAAEAAPGGGLLALDPRSAEVLTRSLRHRLFGRELLLDGSLEAGLLRIAIGLALAAAGARSMAGGVAGGGRTPLTPTGLSRAHMVATRTLHRPEPHRLLAANGAQVWPILDALPLLG
jgi:Fe-S-cluster containining protein